MICGLVGDTVLSSAAVFITFSFPTGKGCVTSDFVAQLIFSLFDADCLPLANQEIVPIILPLPSKPDPHELHTEIKL